MVTRRLAPARRRELILAAAVEVFAEHGAGGATLDDVARGAGVTKPLLYRHVASKDALYAEVLEAQAAGLVASVTAALPPGTTVDRPAVSAAVDGFLAWVQANPSGHRLLVRDPEAGAAAAAVHARVQAELSAALAAALAADPQVLAGDGDRERALALVAQILKTGLNGLAAWWWANPEADRERVRERALALLWPGIEELRG